MSASMFIMLRRSSTIISNICARNKTLNNIRVGSCVYYCKSGSDGSSNDEASKELKSKLDDNTTKQKKSTSTIQRAAGSQSKSTLDSEQLLAASDKPDKQSKQSKLDNKKPGQAIKARREANSKTAEMKDHELNGSVDPSLEQKLVSAVDEVAQAMSGDQQKIRSELLQKLQEHVPSSQPHSSTVSSLFAGMHVDKWSQRPHLTRDRLLAGQRKRDARDQLQSTEDIQMPSRKQPSSGDRFDRSQFRRVRGGSADTTSLFSGPSLEIFTAKQVEVKNETAATAKPTLFDMLEEEETVRLMSMPPNNAFDELIQWTKEGKLWTFPVDNEQGWEDEANTGFHEHVFLEKLIDSRFPRRGPIRHFMELVSAGLSHNPYYTAAEKRAHIAWYADYFKDKLQFVDDATQSDERPTPAATVQRQ